MQKSENSNLLISVIICTYNRADLLAIALQTLCEQTLDSSYFEIIVVDNNSKDTTRSIADDFICRHPNIVYFLETAQGLSNARNRGWREAKGTYVAYIDDECKVPIQWLSVAKKLIIEKSPIMFGGPYFSYYSSLRPRWWKDNYESFSNSDTARDLIPGEFLRGANFFIQRGLYNQIGGFNTNLGMNGTKINYGEEAELQKRISEIMPDEHIYYDPKLFVYHLVRPEKMTFSYIISSRFIGGRNIYNVFWDESFRKSRLLPIFLLAKLAAAFLIFLGSFFAGLLRTDRKQYPYLHNYLYEKTFEHIRTMGVIYERYLHCRVF